MQTASNTAYDQPQIKNKSIIGLVLTTNDELGLRLHPKDSWESKTYHAKRPFDLTQTASNMAYNQPQIKNKSIRGLVLTTKINVLSTLITQLCIPSQTKALST